MRTNRSLARSVAAGVAISLAAAVSQVAAATVYTIPPGAFVPALSSTYPVGGTVLDSVVSPFSSMVHSGTLTSEVISGDAANPYGGLTFTYQLDLFGASSEAISQISVSSFASFTTDVSYAGAIGELGPSHVSRSAESGGTGNVVRFSFFTPSLAPGVSSALIVVQTDAGVWDSTIAGIINGETINVGSLAPIAIPEPGTSTLLLTGLAMLGYALRRKARN